MSIQPEETILLAVKTVSAYMGGLAAQAIWRYRQSNYRETRNVANRVGSPSRS
jgi:hypothetical protein